jgi:hypothetical protein
VRLPRRLVAVVVVVVTPAPAHRWPSRIPSLLRMSRIIW